MADMKLEIAKLIGEPINAQLPVPVELEAIADTFTAEVGEKIWRYTAFDTSLDTILAVDPSTGIITLVPRSATGDAELTFKGLQSKLEYVLIDAIIGESDNTQILARRKVSISRGMDKRELRAILNAITGSAGFGFGVGDASADYLPGVTPEEVTMTGNDIYDVIMEMKHKVEDYGDNFVLLVGSTVKEKIDTYDKDKASTFAYNVTLSAKLKELGITVMKVFGKVESTDGGGEEALLDPYKLILVARNSRIAEGKPIKFVRRKISPAIAQLMGADVDNTQRALWISPTPMQQGTNTLLAYGIYGYESVIFTITNPKAICIADATSILS